MNTKYTHIFLLILTLAFLLPGCRTVKAPAFQQQENNTISPGWTSDRDKLRSTVMLIEASKQKMLGNWSQAAVLYHDAIGVDPGNDAAHFELSKIHASQGEFEDALGYIETAVELSPNNTYYLTTLADIYILSSRLDQAIAVYKDLNQRHPENIQYALNLASAHLYADQKLEALSMFQHIESLIGFSEEISVEKQKVLIELEMYDEAIEEAKMLVNLFPDAMVYYELLAELYRETGQLEEAAKLYSTMLENNPDNPLLHLLMADYYLETGKKDDAFTSLLSAFRHPLLDTEGKARIIYRYYLLSEDDPDYLKQGLKLCEILVEMHPDDPEAYLIYADFLNRDERFEKAREMYLMASFLDPSNLAVWQQILSLDGRLADFQSMREHSEKALEYFFEQPLLFLFNGLAHIQLKNYEEAASSLEFGLSLTGFDDELKGDFFSLLGDNYHFLDNHEQSDRYYEKALEINPENATVLNNYSYHLAVRKERLDEAEKMSKKANSLEVDNASFQDTYGWIMYKMGRYKEARVWIEKSIQNMTEPSATVLEHYGDVMYRLGNKQEALNYWEKAREAGEGSEFLNQKINDKTLYE
jgi:tetratricopeptide (TPR) repeat protein